MTIAKTIRIIKRPQGDPPDWVKDAWIGCVLPCAGFECGHVQQYVHGVLSRKGTGLIKASELRRKDGPQKIDGYSVYQAEALRVLIERSPKAAAWWHQKGCPKTAPDEDCFRFKLEEVEVVTTYADAELQQRGPMHVWSDLEQNWVS